MPDPDLLTPLGEKLLGMIPPELHGSADYQAVEHVLARELELLESKIEQVRDQFNPSRADVLLKAWEAMLGMTIEPSAQTLAERRQNVVAMLQRMRASPTGLDWEANVTRLIGDGWTYAEHDPDDLTSPPGYTIRVVLPFSNQSSRYALVQRLLRDITPANTELVLLFAGGFQLDSSQLDEEGFLY